MYTDNKNKKKENNNGQMSNQQSGFMEGDGVVPQGGHVRDFEEPVEENSDKVNKSTNSNKNKPEIDQPMNEPQKTEKKIPNIRNNS